MLLSLILAAIATQAAQDPTPLFAPATQKAVESELSDPLPQAHRQLDPNRDLGTPIVPVIPTELKLDRVFVDSEGLDDIWVHGANYKAHFGTQGVQFIPFLGPETPRNFPVQLELQGAHFGAVSLNLDTQPSPQLLGDLVLFEHGPVSVEYSLSLEGVEQSFWVHEVPHDGDLLLAIRVQTDLECEPNGLGLRFTGPYGGVDYTQAFALPDGAPAVPLETTWSAGQLEIRVPAEVLRDCVLPLRIDPILSTWSYMGGSLTVGNADVAYEGANLISVIATEVIFSATDHDIWLLTQDSTGQPSSGPSQTLIDASDANWREPSVASNRLAGQVLVVASVGPDGSREVWGRTRETENTSMGSPFRISSLNSGDNFHADVGGDPVVLPPTYYAVVWENAGSSGYHNIHVRGASSAGSVSTSEMIISGTLQDNRDPAISKSNGAEPFSTQRWNVTFDRVTSDTGAPLGIHCAQLNWNLQVVTPSFALGTSGAFISDGEAQASPPLDAPSSNSNGTRDYMITYTKGSSFGDTDIYAEIYNEATWVTEVNFTTIVGSLAPTDTSAEDQGQSYVNTDGTQFQVAWSETVPSGPLFTDRDTRTATVFHYGETLALREPFTPLGTGPRVSEHPRIAAIHDGGYFGGTSLSIWVSRNVSTATDNQIRGSVYDLNDDWKRVGLAGCAGSANSTGKAASLRWSGSSLISDDRMLLDCDNLPSNEFCLFIMSKNTGSIPFGQGTICLTSPIVRLNPPLGTGASGAAARFVSLPVVVPGNSVFTGESWWAQCWYRDQGSFNLSNSSGALFF